MIDMAHNPKKNSRLSCQLIVSEKLDGIDFYTRKTILMKKTDTIIIGVDQWFVCCSSARYRTKFNCRDNLDKRRTMYRTLSDKPIYDIPAVPGAERLTKKLLEQIKPFNSEFLNEELKKLNKTKKIGLLKLVIIMNFQLQILNSWRRWLFRARKLSVKDAERFENKFLFYSVRDKEV